MRTALVVVTLLVLAPVVARADAIDGPPACPPGTRGRSAHEGRWCEAMPCTDDAACGEGSTCRAWRVCTQTSMVEPGGLRARPEPAAPRELAVASCEVSAACRGTEEPPPPTVGVLRGRPACVDGRFCVAASLPAFPSGFAATSPDPTAGSGAAGSVASNTPTAPATAPSSCLCTLASDDAGSRVPLALGLFAMLVLAARRRAS